MFDHITMKDLLTYTILGMLKKLSTIDLEDLTVRVFKDPSEPNKSRFDFYAILLNAPEDKKYWEHHQVVTEQWKPNDFITLAYDVTSMISRYHRRCSVRDFS